MGYPHAGAGLLLLTAPHRCTTRTHAPTSPTAAHPLRSDVYPLIAAVAVGCSFMVYKGVEHMFAPDVHWDRSRRGGDPWERFDAKEGEAWADRMSRHYRHKDVSAAAAEGGGGLHSSLACGDSLLSARGGLPCRTT